MAKSSDFGAFFREVRKGLGLTLRAFCHRNGFDPGNVSRIELGKAPPPKKEEGLEKYAKALKLKRGTDRYNRFFDLAAQETGRIPAELMGSQGTAGRLPKLLQRLRSGSGHRNWVTARHLHAWGDTLAARAVLPQLVRRLVHATGRSITGISFPALEQTQRKGLDGVVDAGEADAFVPLGRSVWEMGVNQTPAAKAEEDFDKRRTQKLGFDKKAATYVFVTPRNWGSKDGWVEAKNKLGVWRQVRVYDSAGLEEWLELAPAVDVWLARQLGIRPDGLSDIEEYWERLSGVTEPPLDPAVFVASRGKQSKSLEEWLKGPPGVVAIETRSPAEAIDFVAAVVRRAAERDAVMARTVIVEDKNAWRSMCLTDSRLVLVAHPDLSLEPDLVADAVQRGHHVVLPVLQSITEQVHTLILPRVYRHDLEEALKQSGLVWREAADLAAKAGGSLTVLKRLLAKVRGTTAPPWSRAAEATALVLVLLAGAWEDHHEGDKAALSRLAGRPYEEVTGAIARWLDTADPPVKRVLSRWSLVSRDDSWHLMAHAVTAAHLRVFRDVAVDVLSENDPAFDLPPDERWMASVKGRVLNHTHTLRGGIAETLALLGSRPERVTASTEASAVAAAVVRTLLKAADWKRWASLSSQLPLLAEAAPDAFLTAVEADLRSKNPAIPVLFEQDGRSVIFSSAPHAGLLWALEGLAWNRGELARVSAALARLDELVDGKKMGNSPISTLTAIYLPWYPQTTSPIDERAKVICTLCRRHPKSGWWLLLELLPDQVRHSTPIRRPAFRDWALAWTERLTNADYERQVVAYSDLAVDLAGTDLARLRELIEHFESLAGTAGENLLERLRTLDLAALTKDARRMLSDTVREKVNRHRRFKDADWALPEEALVKLEEVQRRLEPDDAVSKNAWLFNQIWEVIARDENTGEAEVVARREEALQEVRAASGWGGLLSLAQVVKAPDELGVVVGRSGSAKDDREVLPRLLEDPSEGLRKFAQGYVWGRFQAAGWEWVGKLKVRAWPPAAVADAALCLPNEPRAWALAARRGEAAANEFWLRTTMPVWEPTPETVREAVTNLVRHGRPFQACFVISMARHKTCEVPPDLAAEAFEAGLTGPVAEGEAKSLGARRHYVIELLEYLQREAKRTPPGVGQARVARLEWGYLPLLDGHPAIPVTLLSMLEADPKFFVDLLVAIFRPSGEGEEERKEPTEQEKTQAESAFRLLMAWKRVPGTKEDGAVDGDALFEWTRRGRAMANEQKRLEVFDSRFGSVLAYSPKEPADEAWPCIAVRDLVEEIGSEALENGLEVGVYNKRGVYRKAIAEGGVQEREYASRYRGWAEACQVEWPRTAASLRRIADGYERDASRADADTELRLS